MCIGVIGVSGQIPSQIPSQISKMEISAKTAKDLQSLTFFAKNSIPEVWPSS